MTVSREEITEVTKPILRMGRDKEIKDTLIPALLILTPSSLPLRASLPGFMFGIISAASSDC